MQISLPYSAFSEQLRRVLRLKQLRLLFHGRIHSPDSLCRRKTDKDNINIIIMERSLTGEIIYEIINYSGKGIIHNYNGLNTHFQEKYRDSSQYKNHPSEEILKNAVNELVRDGILHKIKKDSFCITKKGSDFVKYTSKLQIITKYSHLQLLQKSADQYNIIEQNMPESEEHPEYFKGTNSDAEKTEPELCGEQDSELLNTEVNLIKSEPVSATGTFNSDRSDSYSQIVKRFNPVKETESLESEVVPHEKSQNSINMDLDQEEMIFSEKSKPDSDLETSDILHKTDGKIVFDELISGLNSENKDILKHTLFLLGETGNPSVIPEIEKYLYDPRYEIFETAFEALSKIKKA